MVAVTSKTPEITGETVVVATAWSPLTAASAVQTALEPWIPQTPPRWTVVPAAVASRSAEK